MRKIFLDCGYYAGKALEYYAPFMDETWEVYAFEPNTKLNVEETIKRFPFKIKWIKKAVWIEDGEVSFITDARDDAHYIRNTRVTRRRGRKVPCIDFSKFVARLPDTTIACSMDIEGSEFSVLEKMLKDGTVQKLSLLDIEFHHRFMDKTPADADSLRRRLEGEGVLVKLKIPLEV